MVKLKPVQIRMQGFTVEDYKQQAIALLKFYEPLALQRCDKGYIVGYSGGKDSDALVELFFEAGVKHHIIHNHTTLDAPETVYYIRRRFAEFQERGQTAECIMPLENGWQLCERKGMLPTRLVRFCCAELKECQKKEYLYAVYSFGVRALESVSRKKNRAEIEARNNISKKSQTFRFDDEHPNKVFDVCYSQKYVVVNPMLYWQESLVWEYLESRGLTLENMNPLYKQGFSRVGCIGCPLSSNAREELERYPKYKARWLRTCDKIIASKENPGFSTGAELYDWWVRGDMSVEEYLQRKKALPLEQLGVS